MKKMTNRFNYSGEAEKSIMSIRQCRRHIEEYWRYWLFVLTPIFTSPILIFGGSNESKCAYIVLLMTVYWIFDVIHLAPVSLIPVVAFPLMGILSSEEVCNSYINEANLVFLASLITGVALESSGIQKRIALIILLKIGTSPRMLLFGVMMATVLLSTWIMDTAACAIMIPIVDSIMRHLESVDQHCPKSEVVEAIMNEIKAEQEVIKELIAKDPKKRTRSFIKRLRITPRMSKIPLTEKTSTFEKCLILSVAYSSNIGGLGTLTGTTTNLVLKELAQKIYGKGVGITYATWMMVGLPTTLLCVLCLCGLLQVIALGFKVRKQTPEEKASIKKLIMKHFEDLGPMTYHEYTVVVFLIMLVLMWFFRSPQFMPGWQDLVGSVTDISDSVPAYFIIILMCAFPAVWPPKGEGHNLVEWDSFQKRISWDILLLQGGGFAMAAASDSSGLTKWLGTQFLVLRNLPPLLVGFIISLTTAFMSEILANSSLAAMLIPVMANMAENMHLNPMFLMLPITMAASLAFTLPIATGPNAMVYKTGKLRIKNMIQTGIIADVITVAIMYLMVNSLGNVIFHVNTFPSWAVNVTMDTNSSYI